MEQDVALLSLSSGRVKLSLTISISSDSKGKLRPQELQYLCKGMICRNRDGIDRELMRRHSRAKSLA